MLNKIRKGIMLVIIKINFLFKNDETYLRLIYYLNFGVRLNLDMPKTFNEKINWLKLYDRQSVYSNMADKYEVRKFIKEKVGRKYLVPLLGVYDRFEEIDFSILPQKFVLKTTHDSGSVVICKDKSELNIESSKEILNNSLEKNYYSKYREWPYKNITPKIICEKYLEPGANKSLTDYKVMVFNGKARLILVCSNRDSIEGVQMNFFDENWIETEIYRKGKSKATSIKRPLFLKEMIKISELIGEEFPFIRVDFYEVENNLYIGELTFYPASGLESFYPTEYNLILGEWLDLRRVQDENYNRS